MLMQVMFSTRVGVRQLFDVMIGTWSDESAWPPVLRALPRGQRGCLCRVYCAVYLAAFRKCHFSKPYITVLLADAVFRSEGTLACETSSPDGRRTPNAGKRNETRPFPSDARAAAGSQISAEEGRGRAVRPTAKLRGIMGDTGDERVWLPAPNPLRQV